MTRLSCTARVLGSCGSSARLLPTAPPKPCAVKQGYGSPRVHHMRVSRSAATGEDRALAAREGRGGREGREGRGRAREVVAVLGDLQIGPVRRAGRRGGWLAAPRAKVDRSELHRSGEAGLARLASVPGCLEALSWWCDIEDRAASRRASHVRNAGSEIDPITSASCFYEMVRRSSGKTW